MVHSAGQRGMNGEVSKITDLTPTRLLRWIFPSISGPAVHRGLIWQTSGVTLKLELIGCV